MGRLCLTTADVALTHFSGQLCRIIGSNREGQLVTSSGLVEPHELWPYGQFTGSTDSCMCGSAIYSGTHVVGLLTAGYGEKVVKHNIFICLADIHNALMMPDRDLSYFEKAPVHESDTKRQILGMAKRYEREREEEEAEENEEDQAQREADRFYQQWDKEQDQQQAARQYEKSSESQGRNYDRQRNTQIWFDDTRFLMDSNVRAAGGSGQVIVVAKIGNKIPTQPKFTTRMLQYRTVATILRNAEWAKRWPHQRFWKIWSKEVFNTDFNFPKQLTITEEDCMIEDYGSTIENNPNHNDVVYGVDDKPYYSRFTPQDRLVAYKPEMVKLSGSRTVQQMAAQVHESPKVVGTSESKPDGKKSSEQQMQQLQMQYQNMLKQNQDLAERLRIEENKHKQDAAVVARVDQTVPMANRLPGYVGDSVLRDEVLENTLAKTSPFLSNTDKVGWVARVKIAKEKPKLTSVAEKAKYMTAIYKEWDDNMSERTKDIKDAELAVKFDQLANNNDCFEIYVDKRKDARVFSTNVKAQVEKAQHESPPTPREWFERVRAYGQLPTANLLIFNKIVGLSSLWFKNEGIVEKVDSAHTENSFGYLNVLQIQLASRDPFKEDYAVTAAGLQLLDELKEVVVIQPPKAKTLLPPNPNKETAPVNFDASVNLLKGISDLVREHTQKLTELQLKIVQSSNKPTSAEYAALKQGLADLQSAHLAFQSILSMTKEGAAGRLQHESPSQDFLVMSQQILKNYTCLKCNAVKASDEKYCTECLKVPQPQNVPTAGGSLGGSVSTTTQDKQNTDGKSKGKMKLSKEKYQEMKKSLEKYEKMVSESQSSGSDAAAASKQGSSKVTFDPLLTTNTKDSQN